MSLHSVMGQVLRGSHMRAVFPPLAGDRIWADALVLVCRRLNPKRLLRSSPRLIKRKMPKWHVKRARHANWPQPNQPPVPIIQRT